MSTQSSDPKDSKKGGKKKVVMQMFGFRARPTDLERGKQKAGFVPLAKYIRTLYLMWLNGEIEVTDDDLRKYSQ